MLITPSTLDIPLQPSIIQQALLRMHRFLGMLILLTLLVGCSDNNDKHRLSGAVSTPSAGYPLALQMQASLAPGTYLTGVLVSYARGEDLEPRKLSYRFAPLGYNRFFVVTIDNEKHQIFAETNAPVSYGFMGDEAGPVELSGKPLPDILETALNNGLGQFCQAVPKGKEVILFQLENSSNGSVWRVMANGWDDKGMQAQLRMNIDASSASVSDQSFKLSSSPRTQ